MIELLAVVAITSVLAGLFLPLLGKAKEQAWRAYCRANQRSLVLTWIMYAEDNGERIAQNGYARGGGETQRPMWVQGYYNHGAYTADSTNDLLLTDRRFAQFATYLPSSKVYHCPADRHEFRLRTGRFTKIRSYSRNWFLG